MVTKNETPMHVMPMSNFGHCFCQCASKKRKLLAQSQPNFRLPHHVIPSHYVISLEPDLNEFTFKGSVVIDVAITEPTDTISLNAKDLKIQSVSISNDTGTTFNGCADLEVETQMAHLSFNGKLGTGSWKLALNFTGTLNDGLKGFYRSFWTDKDGNKHVVATTQFESTDARRCFPCFDEPEFKATYKAYLTVDENLTALSNGRIVSSTLLEGSSKKLVEFATTMKMSTYLVCFIVGEFECSEPVYVNGKELRIWANPGKKHLMNFALKSASHAIAWYEKYYRVPYPGGDKIDFIAITDFAAGAMENLGCITFRETALLIDENTATQGELERVAEVVMHELAHMWFGDLVTMKWWNGLWLNESFATFMQLKALAAWKPEWKIWDKFAVSRAAASRVDALNSTHPIECTVVKPEDAQELFDVISYEKGCSTLYQIEQFMGEETFRNGISKYLAKHSFANTETHDLWDSLEESANEANFKYSVRKIMDAWVFTPGHPVLKVSKADGLNGFVKLTQSTFKFLNNDNNNTLFPVPVTMSIMRQGVLTTNQFEFNTKDQTVYVGEDFDYVVVNAGGSGFYRVAYSSDLMAKLSTNVTEKLSVVERFNLVNDTWACVKAKVVSAIDYMMLIELFAQESDPSVWSVILGSLRGLQGLVGKDDSKYFAKLVQKLVTPTFAKLGYEASANESVQTRQLRGSLMSALGTIGEDKKVKAHAAKLFAAWKKDKTSIDANVLPAVVTILAYGGDKKRYYEFKDMFKNATTPQDTNRFMYSLADFPDLELLKETLESCINGEIRTQDAPFVIQRLLSNDVSATTAWSFIQSNWDKLVEAYPANGVVRMISGISALDSNNELLTEVKNFFANHPVESGSMALAQAMEQQRINYEARVHHTPILTNHFASVKA